MNALDCNGLRCRFSLQVASLWPIALPITPCLEGPAPAPAALPTGTIAAAPAGVTGLVPLPPQQANAPAGPTLSYP